VAAGLVPVGVGVDEDTALVVDGGTVTVAGLGAAHVVRPAAAGVTVESVPAGPSRQLEFCPHG
jgi:cyanophycinase